MTQPANIPSSAAGVEARGLHAWFHTTSGRTFSRAQKLLLLAAIVLACVITWGVERSMGVPRVKGFSASLVQNSGLTAGTLAVTAAFAASLAVTTLLVGRIRPDAPIFCSALGLILMRVHGAPAHKALIVGGGTPALRDMATEMAILSILLIAGFLVLRLLVSKGILPDDAERDGAILATEKIDQRLLCTVAVASISGVILRILCQSDQPTQVFWSVFIAGWGGAWCAFRFIPTAPAVWYWAGPLVLGLTGYVYAMMYGGPTTSLGRPAGFLSALARPAPLDYATVGVAGALIAYWTSRRHFRDRAEHEQNTPPPPPPAVTYSTG